MRLADQPADSQRMGQDLGIECQEMERLKIEIASIYSGEWVVDPSQGNMPAPPTHNVALAEVTIYEPGPTMDHSLIFRFIRKLETAID